MDLFLRFSDLHIFPLVEPSDIINGLTGIGNIKTHYDVTLKNRKSPYTCTLSLLPQLV